MPPPVDPYASLSSIAALSAQMNGIPSPFNNGNRQVKQATRSPFSPELDSICKVGDYPSVADEMRRKEQEKADYEYALKLSQQHDNPLPNRPPRPVPSHQMPNQSNSSLFSWN